MEVKVTRTLLLTTYILVAVLSLILGTLVYPILSEPEKEVILVPFELESPRITEANIAAVAQNQNVGIIGMAEVEIRSGSGKILIETNPFLETDTQFSAQTAKDVAEKYTRKALRNYDFIYSFDIRANVLGGPSAGAAMTLATIANIEDKSVRSDAVITGTIEVNGRIGSVGGIMEKGIAAAEAGATLFVVPLGQSTTNYYERAYEDRNSGDFTFRNTRLIPRSFNISEYLKETYNLTVIEVASIGDAVSLMIV